MQIMYAGVLGTAMLLQAQMTERSVKTQYLACSPERQFAHAERLRGSGDTSGLRAFTRGALLSGTCISLEPGVAVFAVGKGKGEAIIRVRPKGAFQTFFTSEQAFD
jgi:hypothetical protein